MKKILIAVVILSLATIACEAFKDSYDQDLGPQTPNPSENSNTNGGTTDFSTDKTLCQAVSGVTAVVAKDSGVVKQSELSTAGIGSAAKAEAKKIGDFTTQVTVSAGDESISFVLKQTAEGFDVCSVSYNKLTVTKGTITVDSFNVGAAEDMTKAVNAGTFSFEFASEASSTALKAMEELAGADTTVKVDGSYFATGLEEIEVKAGE
jgi:hypothetical protein